LTQERFGVQHLTEFRRENGQQRNFSRSQRLFSPAAIDDMPFRSLRHLEKVLVLEIVPAADDKDDRFLKRCPCPRRLFAPASFRIKIAEFIGLGKLHVVHDGLDGPGDGKVLSHRQHVSDTRDKVVVGAADVGNQRPVFQVLGELEQGGNRVSFCRPSFAHIDKHTLLPKEANLLKRSAGVDTPVNEGTTVCPAAVAVVILPNAFSL